MPERRMCRQTAELTTPPSSSGSWIMCKSLLRGFFFFFSCLSFHLFAINKALWTPYPIDRSVNLKWLQALWLLHGNSVSCISCSLLFTSQPHLCLSCIDEGLTHKGSRDREREQEQDRSVSRHSEESQNMWGFLGNPRSYWESFI